MPKPLPPKEEFIAMRMAKAEAKAEKEWEQRGTMGRIPHSKKITNAIVKIVQANGGISGPKVELWTEAKWITEIEKALMENGDTMSGVVTTKKYLKTALRLAHTPLHLIPLHLIPARWVQDKPREERMDHFFSLALWEAKMMSIKKNGSMRTNFSTVNDSHRRLCNEYLWKAKRLPEGQRAEWYEKRFREICAANAVSVHPSKVGTRQ